MANDRLYIVNTSTKEYLCIAKDFAMGWSCGNLDLYKEFLLIAVPGADTLILGTENNNDFWYDWIRNGVNYNSTGKWE